MHGPSEGWRGAILKGDVRGFRCRGFQNVVKVAPQVLLVVPARPAGVIWGQVRAPPVASHPPRPLRVVAELVRILPATDCQTLCPSG